MGDLGLKEIEGGFRIKETDTHTVEVMVMMWNFRITRTPKINDGWYDRGWCYFGRTPQSFVAAVLAANAWDGADDTAPTGWHKNTMTGEISDEGRALIDGRRGSR